MHSILLRLEIYTSPLIVIKVQENDENASFSIYKHYALHVLVMIKNSHDEYFFNCFHYLNVLRYFHNAHLTFYFST